MLGLSPLELVLLAGLGLALFGPDKLPGAVREGVRIVRHIRAVADGARAELLEQIGPELRELDPRRLDLRAVVREELAEALDPAISAGDDLRSDLRGVREVARSGDAAPRLSPSSTHSP